MQFYKALDEALKANAEGGVSVLCLDLDGFKPVNDTFGHAAGDDVLKMVADRLRAEVKGHMVARLGGDEFAVLMVADPACAIEMARRCVAACERPFPVRGLAIKIGVSIGIAIAPANGVEGERLVQEADRALYCAKANGRNTWQLASIGPSSQKAG